MGRIKLTTTNKTVKEGFNDFIKYKKARNLSPATIDYYRETLSRFILFLEAEKLNEINKNIIDKYIIYLQNNFNLTNQSINTHLRAVRAFLYYCMELNYLAKFKVEMVETQEKVKDTYTKAELKVLLKKPKIKNTTFAEFRTWVLINWLLATGNRLGTIVNIKIKDLDFDNELIYLNYNKNKKANIIPMSKTLQGVLQEYILFRKGNLDDYLFCTVTGGKITKEGLTSSLERYHKKRGIMSHSIHKYRHTFSKLAVMQGIDPLRLQRLLGHSTLDMTRKYVNLFGTDLKKDFDRYNPLEQLTDNKGETIKIR